MITKTFLSLFNQFKFILKVLGRAIIVMFRRRQQIQLLRLEYCDQHLFENSYIILQYRFRNALWYRIGKHKTLEKELKIFNLKNFEKEFDFIVYGLFRKKVYKLKFEPKWSLDTTTFKTEVQSKSLELMAQPNLIFGELDFRLTTPLVYINTIDIQITNIAVAVSNYNQTDFI